MYDGLNLYLFLCGYNLYGIFFEFLYVNYELIIFVIGFDLLFFIEFL